MKSHFRHEQWPKSIVLTVLGLLALTQISAGTTQTSFRTDVNVSTELGDILGFVTDIGPHFAADIFLGIPFAKPPVAERRFEKPEPIEPWTIPVKAQEFSKACYPHYLADIPKDKWDSYGEDCLTLNIFRPHVQFKKPASGWPVLVYIHGGGFSIGASRIYGYEAITQNFVTQGVIAVTINYRLGFEGFLSTGDSVLPGNLGYWDQTEALKFIKKHISAFGGDPDNITIWGLSAGGASTSSLSISPHSRDLFKNVIAQSGVASAVWAQDKGVIDTTLELATFLKCPNLKNSLEIKKCFKERTPHEFLEAVNTLGGGRKAVNLLKFQPIIDGDFFPKDILDLVAEAPPKPVMLGATDQEALFFTILGHAKSINVLAPSKPLTEFDRNDFVYAVKNIIAPDAQHGQKSNEIQQKIINFFLSDETPDSDHRYYLERYTDLFTELQFVIPMLLEARARSAAGSDVYLYFHNYHNPNMYNNEVPIKGSAHANEYPYMFGLHGVVSHFQWNEDDYKVQRAVVDTIVQFAKTSNPSLPSLQWPKITAGKPLVHLNINPNPDVGENLYEEKYSFWKNLTNDYDFDFLLYKPKNTGKNTHNEL